MKSKLWLGLALLCAFAAIAPSAVAQLEIVGEGQSLGARIPIAVPPCASSDPSLASLARDLAQVISDDLQFSGLFDVLTPERFPAGFVALDPDVQRLDREAWSATGAEHLVFGNLKQEGGTLVTEFRLFDLFSKNQVPTRGDPGRLPRVAEWSGTSGRRRR